MANFLAELKRRHIYRVAAAYAVVAWVLLQIVNNIIPLMQAPVWTGQFCLLLLALGFPIAVFFAWMRELPASDAAAPARTSVMDGALIGVLVAVLVAVSYQHFAPSRSNTTEQASVAAARQASISPTGTISLAVLPFSNISGDASQDFFSDGMTEEIVTALAKIPDLRVVARGSASQFKGERKDLRAVGQALGATHLIEGSVRKAGTQVRISAQLVKADDGVNIWVNSYDRELTDVFAIQEEIATAIAGALRMPLGLKPGEQLVSNRAIDPESYQQFLRAKAVLLRGRAAFAETLAILEPLVARNPNYAPAWAKLGQAYISAMSAGTRNVSAAEAQRVRETYGPKMEAAARRAIALDPNSVNGIVVQAYLQAGPRRWALIEDALAKGLSLDASNPDVLSFYSGVLVMVGRVKEGIAVMQQLHELEPFIPLYDGNLADALWVDGQNEAAIAKFKENLGRVGSGSGPGLARIYASLGRYEEAADVLSRFPGNALVTTPGLSEVVVRLLRSAPAEAASPETLPALGGFGFIYLHIGAPERALEFYEQAPRDTLDILPLWHPSYAPVRKMERFKAVVRAAGLFDYWRERGWPDLCRPQGADDFVCD